MLGIGYDYYLELPLRENEYERAPDFGLCSWPCANWIEIF